MKNDRDLHRKLSDWDNHVHSTNVPPYHTLIDYLCRRIISSRCLVLVGCVVRFLLRCLLYFLGFEEAHKRIQEDHDKDAINNCWYCPKLADDRFGLRPGETILDASTLPNQVQISYAIIIRGLAHDPSTSILDGLGEDNNNNNKNVSPGRLKEDFNSPMVHRAALLILSILKAREFYCGDQFNPDMYREKPLTMQWYSYLFGTSIQFHRELIERYTTSREFSRHIVVIYQEKLYKVHLIRKDVMGEDVMPTYEEIKRQMERVVQMSTDKSALCVNPLTTLPAKERYLLEQNLREASDRNRYNFGIIRDCLLVVSLDSEDSPRMANETLYFLHSKNFSNRWYDRSVNLVVFKNGVAGFVMNYLCGMTGTVVSSFVQLIKQFEEEILQKLQEENSAKHDQIKLKELSSPSLLSWDDTEDSTISRKMKLVRSLKNQSCPFTPSCPAMFKLRCDATRDKLICLGVSPSGTFQAALQLALMQMCKRPMGVFEIISIRHFKFGGLAWMETNTADMRLFITAASEYLANPNPDSKATLKALLLGAIKLYREDVLRHKKGEISLWHLDAIYRALGLQTRLPGQRSKAKNLRSFLQQPLIDYLRRCGDYNAVLPPRVADTFTSNPSWNPAVEAVGRVGVKSMLPLGVHYLFSQTSIAVTVCSSKSHPCHRKHKEFAKELDKAFKFIIELLTEDDQG